jgi:hypothetical protein
MPLPFPQKLQLSILINLSSSCFAARFPYPESIGPVDRYHVIISTTPLRKNVPAPGRMMMMMMNGMEKESRRDLAG